MAALGDAVLESVDVHQLAEYLQELIATNGILKRELAARDDTIRQLTVQLDDQHEHAAGLDHALKASKRTLKALHAKLVSNEKVHAQERAALDHDLATLRDRCRRLHGGIHLNRDASPVNDDAGYSSSGWTTATSASPIDADGSDDGRMSRANTTTPEPPSDGDTTWANGTPPPVPPLPTGTPPPHPAHYHHLRSASPPRRSPSAGYPSKPTSRARGTQASFPDPRVAALTDANRALERKLHETALNLTLAQAALHNAESTAFDRAREAAAARSDVLEMQRSLESLREQNEGYKLLLEEKTLNGEWHVDDWAEHARNARLAVAVDRHVVRHEEVVDHGAEDTLGIDEGDVPDHDDPMEQWGATEGEVVGESLGAFFGGNAPDETAPVGESLGAFFGRSSSPAPPSDAPATTQATEPTAPVATATAVAAALRDPAPGPTSPRPRCPADSLESELARAALNSENDAQIAVLNSEVKALQLYISTILTRIMDASPSDDEEHDHEPTISAAARARSASRIRRRISRPPPGRRGTSSKPNPVAGSASADRRIKSERPPLAAGLMTSPHGLLRSNDDPEANALESSLALAKRSAPLPPLLGNWRTPSGSAAPSPAASRRSSTGHSHLGPLVDAPGAQAADAPAELAAEHYFRPAESEVSFDDPNALATVTPPPSIAIPPPPPSRAPTTREPSPAAQPAAPASRTASTTRRRGSSRTRWRTRSPARHAADPVPVDDKDATGSGMEAALRIAAWFSGRQWAQQQKQHAAAAPAAAAVSTVAPDATTDPDAVVPPPPPTAPNEEELPLDAARAVPDELEALIAPPPPVPTTASAAAADSDECPYDESTRRRVRSPATSPVRPASKYRAWAFMRRLHGSAATPPPDQQPPPIPEEDDTEPATATSSVAGDAATVAAAQAAQRRIAKTRTRRPWSAFLGGGGSSRRSGADRTPPTSQVEAESSVPRAAAVGGGRRGSGYDEDDEADDDELRVSRQAIAMATAMAPVPRFDRSRSPSVEATTSAGKVESAEPPVPMIPAAPLVMSPPASIVEEDQPLQRQPTSSDQSADGMQSRPRSLLGMLGTSAATPPSLPAAVAPATTTDGARPSILRDSLARSVFPAVLGRRRSSATSSSATPPTPEPMSPPSVAASSLPSPRLSLARPFAWTGSSPSGVSTPPGPPPPLPPRRRSSATAGASADSPASTAPATPVTPATAVLDADVATMSALTLAASSPAESTVLHAMARAMATSAPRDPFRWARGGLGAGAGAGAGHGATAAAAAAMMGLAIRPGMVLAATSAAAVAAASSAPGMHLHAAHANANPWAAPVHPMPSASHAPTEGQ
ncbi:hypothetical protein GGF31_002092 [Allomyces arbusculus]|nr:hypothetical protein GGF31_002092 [Allomyces arbusculus]